jgi:hypothetical protein
VIVKTITGRGLRAGIEVQQVGDQIAAFLNDRPSRTYPARLSSIDRSALESQKAAYPLVIALVEHFDREIQSSFFRVWSYPFPKLARDADEAAERAFQAATEKYDEYRARLFEGIRFVPEPLLMTSRQRYRYLNRWQVVLRNGKRIRNRDARHVMGVLDLAMRGLLHRLRHCDNCRRWFYARFEKQRFCSDACREKSFRSTPEGRAARAKYMRRYRSQPSAKKGKRK